MPELPEVETVRRGLEPVMQGARFVKVEARRPDLRFALPADFVRRLQGKSVTGLGRRGKYLLADLSSGEVLLMLGTPGQPGQPGMPFNMPTAAAQAPNGDILVSDGYGQNWMHRFSASGELILSWGGGDPVFIQRQQQS